MNTCNNLMYLPPVERLIKLQIISFPKLKDRYAKETGANWFKISHIPNVRIYWLKERSARGRHRCFDVSCQTKMTQNSNNTIENDVVSPSEPDLQHRSSLSFCAQPPLLSGTKVYVSIVFLVFVSNSSLALNEILTVNHYD